jgi:hypothetical protein
VAGSNAEFCIGPPGSVNDPLAEEKVCPSTGDRVVAYLDPFLRNSFGCRYIAPH